MIVLVFIHKLVLLVRIVRRGDAIVRRLALLAQACSQGMYARTAGVRLQGVRKRREEDNSESADGDDDRSPGVPTRDLSAHVRVLREMLQATYMAITLLLTPCPKVRYPTIPSFVKRPVRISLVKSIDGRRRIELHQKQLTTSYVIAAEPIDTVMTLFILAWVLNLSSLKHAKIYNTPGRNQVARRTISLDFQLPEDKSTGVQAKTHVLRACIGKDLDGE